MTELLKDGKHVVTLENVKVVREPVTNEDGVYLWTKWTITGTVVEPVAAQPCQTSGTVQYEEIRDETGKIVDYTYQGGLESVLAKEVRP